MIHSKLIHFPFGWARERPISYTFGETSILRDELVYIVAPWILQEYYCLDEENDTASSITHGTAQLVSGGGIGTIKRYGTAAWMIDSDMMGNKL